MREVRELTDSSHTQIRQSPPKALSLGQPLLQPKDLILQLPQTQRLRPLTLTDYGQIDTSDLAILSKDLLEVAAIDVTRQAGHDNDVESRLVALLGRGRDGHGRP